MKGSKIGLALGRCRRRRIKRRWRRRMMGGAGELRRKKVERKVTKFLYITFLISHFLIFLCNFPLSSLFFSLFIFHICKLLFIITTILFLLIECFFSSFSVFVIPHFFLFCLIIINSWRPNTAILKLFLLSTLLFLSFSHLHTPVFFTHKHTHTHTHTYTHTNQTRYTTKKQPPPKKKKQQQGTIPKLIQLQR